MYEIGRAYFENYLESCKEEISIKEVANEISRRDLENMIYYILK